MEEYKEQPQQTLEEFTSEIHEDLRIFKKDVEGNPDYPESATPGEWFEWFATSRGWM